MSWLIPRTRLTAEQIRAVELPPSEHRLILGGPGSGKTQVLLHRADYLRRKLSVPPERFRIFVFTNTLTEYIASALSDLSIPTASVATLASWAVEFHKRNVGAPPKAQGNDIDWPLLYERAADYAVRAKPSIFEFVLVDEGQDLDRNAYRLLRSVSGHVTVCMDHKQQIFSDGADEKDILLQLGLRKRNLALLDALRCSPYIMSIASELVHDAQEARDLLAQARTTVVQRETPVVCFARDFEDEITRLVEVIRTRQIAGDRIGVLFPQRRMMQNLAHRLREAGLGVEVQEELDFSSDAPKLLTYYSAKGLTFDSVVMPQLYDKAFPYRSRAEIERLLFVGVSRAIKWAYFGTYEGVRFAPLDKVLALEGRGQVTVLRASHRDHLGSDHQRIAQTDGKDDLLDFL